MKHIFLTTFMLLAITQAEGQKTNGVTGYTSDVNPTIVERLPPGPLPDTVRARLSSHGTYTGLAMLVRVGYIDEDSATAKEIADNMGVGLKVVPETGCKVLRFSLSVSTRGSEDLAWPIEGSTLSKSTYAKKAIDNIHPGDRIYIKDIWLQKKDSTIIEGKKFELKVIAGPPKTNTRQR